MPVKHCDKIQPSCPVCKGTGLRRAPGSRWRYTRATDLVPCASCSRLWCEFHKLHRDECPCLEPSEQVNQGEKCPACDGRMVWVQPVDVPAGQNHKAKGFKP